MSAELEKEEFSANASSRLRDVAILISSIEPAAARRLIGMLTPAQQQAIRKHSSELTQVSQDEQVAVLKAFERQSLTRQDVKSDFASQNTVHDDFSWQSLTVDAIHRAMRQERPLVVAVVVSQLPTDRAVAVLSRMGASFSSEVVGQLAQMSQIDSALMAEIDEYLSVKLGEHQHQIESEAENFKKIQSLIGAAPQQFQREWLTASRSAMSSFADCDAASDDDAMSRNTIKTEQNPVTIRPINRGAASLGSDTGSKLNDGASRQSGSQVAPVEFESLLSLPVQVLVRVIEGADQETVLLAIAGASPSFVSRLRELLGEEDFSQLDARVNRLGAIRIRDIDQAQVRLVQQARQLLQKQFDEKEVQTRKAS